MYRYMYRNGVLGSIDIVATISKPKSATICYLILAFEQWFQSLSLIRVFGYIEAATTTTTSSSSSNIITKHEKKNARAAPNANGKWFPVATAHQMRPFISIQTQTNVGIQIRV